MKQATDLYFVAIIPGEPLKTQITGIKQEFVETYGSKAALRSPPHITLHMPFRIKPSKVDKITEGLSELAQETTPFEVCIHGFGAFPPRVIYLQIEESEPLQTMKQRMNSISLQQWKLFDRVDTRPFHPHITVAFRDLRKPAFQDAWATYETKSFNAEFEATALTLLKHNGKFWDEFITFPLTGRQETSN